MALRRQSYRISKRRIALVGLLLAATVALVVVAIFSDGRGDTYDAPSILREKNPVTIGVLGDSTGNGDDEWVVLWAQHLAKTHQVVVHQWDSARHAYTAKSVSLGASGSRVSIWNGSESGAPADFVASSIASLQPEPPDLVIYSFGHNNSADNIAVGLNGAKEAVRKRWGQDVAAAVILQNSGLRTHAEAQTLTTDVVRTWAAQNGYLPVDVRAAFARAPETALHLDDRHPNAAGNHVWADVVAKALG